MRNVSDADYSRAIDELGNIVFLCLSEIYGGLHEHAVRQLGHFAAAARERDTTEYHDPPGDKRLSIFEHWTRALSAAAVYGDAARVLAHRKRVKEAVASGRAAQISHGAARA